MMTHFWGSVSKKLFSYIWRTTLYLPGHLIIMLFNHTAYLCPKIVASCYLHVALIHIAILIIFGLIVHLLCLLLSTVSEQDLAHVPHALTQNIFFLCSIPIFCFSPPPKNTASWAGGRRWNARRTSTTLLWHRVKQSQAFLGARRLWG